MRLALALVVVFLPVAANAQSWRNCVQGSMGPGGCESMGPGGGRSMGPGGGLSMGPGGGESMGPGGGQSMGPGGGLSLDRDWNRGLDPRTLRDPHPYGSFDAFPGVLDGNDRDDDE
jgi:hypothetical protein